MQVQGQRLKRLESDVCWYPRCSTPLAAQDSNTQGKIPFSFLFCLGPSLLHGATHIWSWIYPPPLVCSLCTSSIVSGHTLTHTPRKEPYRFPRPLSPSNQACAQGCFGEMSKPKEDIAPEAGEKVILWQRIWLTLCVHDVY